jgi:urease accessory protein
VKANALLTVERSTRGRGVVRELRSRPPLTLLPRRALVPEDVAIVHMVGSATSPVGGDDVELRVRVGPGARLRLCGTAASLALPGQRPGGSRTAVRIEVAEGGTVEYLPEPTVVTARANHSAELRVDMAEDARIVCREVLVLGRSGEDPGVLRTTTHVVQSGVPLFRQSLDLGDPRLRASPAGLAGSRVIASAVVVWDHDPASAFTADWCSLVGLPRRGALATALAADAVQARRRLDQAIGQHPDAADLRRPRW